MVAVSDSYSNDVFMIAQAFQQASEEDTRHVLNAMAAKKTQSSLQDLHFYLVPAAWMVKAWPMLSVHLSVAGANSSTRNSQDAADDGNKWREKVGPICVGELLWDHTVSSSDDEEGDKNNGNNGPPKTKTTKKPQPSSSSPLRNELTHGEDYFLVGANAWLILKEKFGSDGIEIRRACVFHSAEESTLAVALDQHYQNGGTNGSSAGQARIVPIPPAGYFPYQKLIDDLEGDSQETFLPQIAAQQPKQRPVELKPSDVVSDEEGESNDLFPGPTSADEPDDMVLSGESDSRMGNTSMSTVQEGSVLLLPPSTTASSADSSNNTGSLYPSVQDMECVGDQADEEIKEDPPALSGPITASVVPVVAENTRRRYGSGLGNLGNTCFMNSTLQCLAHTDPLRRYFLSGEYEQDLNRGNPLGTGGDLATQFARLLAEMWGTRLVTDRRNVFPKIETPTYVSSTISSVVYPRDFKHTLGKHAEQFMGYDQHDSQELATYLLDALHEDTNRVTNKPYIEKPEKGEDEPDELAASKAWDLHLKRENSKVLEFFMGQIKSRVQCCKPGCGRVSTTFDPFMYLSVPIPGSNERTFNVTFVPLDGNQRRKTLSITVIKTATLAKLTTKAAEQLMKAGLSANGKPFSLDDLCVCDVWNHEIYHWYGMNEELDRIRDSDETFIYELTRISDLKKIEDDDTSTDSSEEQAYIAENLECSRTARYNLDPASMMQLNGDNKSEQWKAMLEKYTEMSPTQMAKILNSKRGTNAERLDLYKELDSFILSCIRESDKASNKRAREEDEDEKEEIPPLSAAQIETTAVSAEEEEVPALLERSDASTTFKGVKTRYDLAMLEVCAERLRRMIVESGRNKGETRSKDGYVIQVIHRRCPLKVGGTSYTSSQASTRVHPLVVRIPWNMTVFEFREEIAKKLARPLKVGRPTQPENSEPAADEDEHDVGKAASPGSEVIPMEGDSDQGDEDQLAGVESMTVSSESQKDGGDPLLTILRQIPMAYKKKHPTNYKHGAQKPLGALESESLYDESRPIKLASQTDENEQQLVAEVVGQLGTVYLDFPAELWDRVFDEVEFDFAEEIKDPEEEEAMAARNRKASRGTSILDCVAKYCQEEQLEETEMWYCNRCKEHVRAWKQFHLYRAPPILIIHLKRFQYSASTHRRDKINTCIDFPLTDLDLTEHVMHWEEGEKPIYDCYAVSNHYGGLGGGHYTAYALHDDGVWCYYDDARITENADEKDVVSDAAYVVYYKRRDLVFSDDLPDGLETPAIVTDQMDSRVRTPSETSSNAANIDDMDVDIHNTDAESNASSKTCSSPMDSHDGGDNNFAETDTFGEGVDEPNDGLYYDHLRESSNTNENYPLQ